MNHADLIAIDTHTHLEVSCWNPCDNYGEEYDRAAGKYFRSSRRPTMAESLAFYREKKIGFVMFTVDAETQMGRRRIPNEEIAEAAMANPDIMIAFGSIDPHKGRMGAREARKLIEEHGVKGFKFHPTVQGMRVVRQRRQRAQVFVDCLQVVNGLLAVHRPRHHLQDLARRVIRVVTGAQGRDEVPQRQAGRLAERVWREVGRREGPELAPARQVLRKVDHLGLAPKRVAVRQVLGMGVAVVAAAGVDDVAAETDEVAVPARKIQVHSRRDDLQTAPDLRPAAQ